MCENRTRVAFQSSRTGYLSKSSSVSLVVANPPVHIYKIMPTLFPQRVSSFGLESEHSLLNLIPRGSAYDTLLHVAEVDDVFAVILDDHPFCNPETGKPKPRCTDGYFFGN